MVQQVVLDLYFLLDGYLRPILYEELLETCSGQILCIAQLGVFEEKFEGVQIFDLFRELVQLPINARPLLTRNSLLIAIQDVAQLFKVLELRNKLLMALLILVVRVVRDGGRVLWLWHLEKTTIGVVRLLDIT